MSFHLRLHAFWLRMVAKPTGFYHALSLYISAIFLATLPWVGCVHIGGCPAHDGVISVSSLVHAEPLATSYALYGGIFLFCLYELQTLRTARVWPSTRWWLAQLGANLLTAPLTIPLGSVRSSYPHLALAGAGFACETLLGAHTLVCALSLPHESHGRNATLWVSAVFAVQLAAVILGSVGLTAPDGAPWLVVMAEYISATSVLVMAELSHIYEL